jgi:glycosyltransferase involved in cell wall biosynthesis
LAKKILISGGLYWNSPFKVGSYHIAKGFADLGWEVGFLSNPISPFHIINGINQELTERWNSYIHGGTVEYNGKIWCYIPGSLLTPNNKPILKSLWLQKNWNKLSFPSVLKKIKTKGFDEVDLLYIGSPNDYYLLNTIHYKKSIFRIADMTSGFSNSTDASKMIETEIAQRVDVVLYTAQNLAEHVKSLSPKKAVYFPNGVNYSHFEQGSNQIPEEFNNIPHPIALYVGALSEWFDFELVNKAAQKLPEVSFVFIGPDALAKIKLARLPNIYILGPRDYNDLTKYMYNSDVGIIPFDLKNHSHLVNSINPLKMYEYMACGLPVLAVEWQELIMIDSPVFLYKDEDEFIVKLKQLCSGDTQNKEHLQSFAKNQDWIKKIEFLSEI